MKRLLIVTDFLRPEPGGLEGLFTSFARFWNPAVLEVLVTAPAGTGVTSQIDRGVFDAGEPYKVHRYPVTRTFSWRKDRGFCAFFLERLDAFSPAHVLFGGLSPAAAQVFSDLPPDLPYSVFLLGSDAKNRISFWNFSARRLLSGARNVYAMSRYLSRAVRDFGIAEDRIALVPPGLDYSPGRRRTLPDVVQKKIEGKVVLLAMGPLVPRRGIDRFIEAAALLPGKEKIHILVIGSGPERAYLDELVRMRGLEGQITFTGLLDERSLAAVLDAADILVHPGCVREDDGRTMGTAIMQAGFAGIPVVAGALEGTEEIVRHGFSGILVAENSTEALCSAISSLIDSEHLRTSMGRNARDLARKEFDIARTCAAIAVRL